MIKITVRTVKFGGTDFTPEALPSADLNDTFGFVNDTFMTSIPSATTADPSGTHETTSTADTDIPGIELNVDVSNVNTKVLVLLNLTMANQGVNETTDVRIKNDTTGAQSHIVFCTPQTSANINFPGSVLWIDTPGATAAVYKGQFSTTFGGTAVAKNVRLSAVELGK